MPAAPTPIELIDSRYAFWRLVVALVAMLMGSSCMFAVPVVLPQVQAEFGISRSEAALPYTLLMIGFGVGGFYMGKVVDRWGVTVSLLIGSGGLLVGALLASVSDGIVSFALAHGLFLGLLGTSATFAPLLADTALWWNKRRGIAVAVCASGNYLAGAVWPNITSWGLENIGWRETYWWMGIICSISMALLSLLLMRRPPVAPAPTAPVRGVMASSRPFGLSTTQAQWLLVIAGVACCVAMSMPQVHIVAYCVDLGYGPARGAEMLSLMLAFGVVSRLVSGLICDRIGGIRTLLLGSVLQGIALLMFLPFDGLVSLYVVSAVFGLFQGGIVPAYAIIIREHFPAAETGRRVGAVMMATMLGMALGGWLSGKLFDLTGSYEAAMVNGVAWNALNILIVVWLFWRLKTKGSNPPAPLVPRAAG